MREHSYFKGSIQHRVRQEFILHDLFPSTHNIKLFKEIIECEGKKVEGALCKIDSLLVEELRSRLRRIDHTIVLSEFLGIGALRTHLCTSYSMYGASKVEGVLSGAILNLLISLFDFVVDIEGYRPNTEKEEAIISAIKNEPRYLEERNTTTWTALFIRLIKVYYHSISSFGIGKQEAIRQLLYLSYIAEMASKQRVGIKIQLQRKSALPFVLFGAPLWNLPDNSLLCRKNFRKLYRIGTYYAYIDDLIDLAEDRENNRPNLVDLSISKNNKSLSTFPVDITLMALRVIDDINEVACGTEQKKLTVNTLKFFNYSWFYNSNSSLINDKDTNYSRLLSRT